MINHFPSFHLSMLFTKIWGTTDEGFNFLLFSCAKFFQFFLFYSIVYRCFSSFHFFAFFILTSWLDRPTDSFSYLHCSIHTLHNFLSTYFFPLHYIMFPLYFTLFNFYVISNFLILILLFDVCAYVCWCVYFFQLSTQYRKEAQTLKRNIEQKLWDYEDNFYKALTYVTPEKALKGVQSVLVGVRELHGYTPWWVLWLFVFYFVLLWFLSFYLALFS